SALISPLLPPLASTAIEPSDQSSTHAVELAGLPGRGGSLQRFLPRGFCCPGPLDSTRPATRIASPSRCTRSAPGPPPRLLIFPADPSSKAPEATITIG